VAALEAKRHGLCATVVSDAIGAVDVAPGDGARALDEMNAAGVDIRTADKVLVDEQPG
jgi:nicotinamidase/pyrazinamidase